MLEAAGRLRERCGALTVSGEGGAPCVDRAVHHGDIVRVGSVELHVLATPGHTAESVSYFLGDRVLTGDALLIRAAGRTDFQNGDAGELYDTLTRVFFRLADETLVYPAHDYRGRTVSTIGEEKRFNTRVAGRTREEFIAIMNGLHLPEQARPWALALAITGASVLGSFGGTALAGRVKPQVLRAGFAWFVLGMAVWMSFKQLPASVSARLGLASATAAPSTRASAVVAPPRHVVFLHMADAHAQLETHPEYMPGETPVLQSMGGYARLKTVIDRERARAKAPTFLADGGDTFQVTTPGRESASSRRRSRSSATASAWLSSASPIRRPRSGNLPRPSWASTRRA